MEMRKKRRGWLPSLQSTTYACMPARRPLGKYMLGSRTRLQYRLGVSDPKEARLGLSGTAIGANWPPDWVSRPPNAENVFGPGSSFPCWPEEKLSCCLSVHPSIAVSVIFPAPSPSSPKSLNSIPPPSLPPSHSSSSSSPLLSSPLRPCGSLLYPFVLPPQQPPPCPRLTPSSSRPRPTPPAPLPASPSTPASPWPVPSAAPSPTVA